MSEQSSHTVSFNCLVQMHASGNLVNTYSSTDRQGFMSMSFSYYYTSSGKGFLLINAGHCPHHHPVISFHLLAITEERVGYGLVWGTSPFAGGWYPRLVTDLDIICVYHLYIYGPMPYIDKMKELVDSLSSSGLV